MEFSAAVSDAIAIFMLWTFGYAGYSKLLPSNTEYYQSVIAGYGLRLTEVARVSVWIIGCVEILAGIMVVLPGLRVVGAMFCGLLFGLYFALIALQILRGKSDLDCGCAGPDQSLKVSPVLLVRNAVFIGLVILCWFAQGASGGSFGAWILPAALAAVLILTSSSAERLVANAQKLARLRQSSFHYSH